MSRLLRALPYVLDLIGLAILIGGTCFAVYLMGSI